MKKAPSGKALYREGLGGRKISFSGLIVLPGIHRAALVDTSISTLSLNFTGPDTPLISKGEQLFDLKITFHLRIKDTPEDVLAAVDHFGLENLTELDDRIPELLNDAEQLVRAAAGKLTWDEINDSPTFIKAILKRLPTGYFKPGVIVDNIAIDHTDKYPPEICASQGVSNQL